MTKVFVMCAQGFFLEMSRSLQAKGVECALLNVVGKPAQVEEYRKAFPYAEILRAHEMHGVPEHLRSLLEPPDLKTIAALAPWEGETLQLLDRRNGLNWSVQQLRHVYLELMSMWVLLLNRHRPDAVVFHASPHQGHDFILFQLCKLRGIRTLIIDRTYLNERLFIRERLEDGVLVDALEAASNGSAEAAAAPKSTLYDSLNQKLNDASIIRRALSLWDIWSTFLHPYTWLLGRGQVNDSLFGLSQQFPGARKYRWLELKGRLLVRDCYSFYLQNSRAPKDGEDFIYFPLHFQPERTTVPDGGYLGDQLADVQTLARAVPSGWRVAVKEHPRQFNLAQGIRGTTWYKGRSRAFYEQLAATPGVDLVPIDVSNEKLLAGCRAVATITGTSGWEALLAAKPALVFGYPWYQKCPGVTRITSVDQARELLAAIRDGRERVQPAAVSAFRAALVERATFRGCFSDQLMQRAGMTAKENGELIADALIRALEQPAPEPAPVSLEAAY